MSHRGTDAQKTMSAEQPKPSVSVLMPCLNEEKYLAGCIKSLLSNDYTGSIEFIIIDGGSTDGTQKIIQGFCKNDARVKMLLNPRRTAPTALNLAVPHASGEIIVRVDAHAVYPENYISRCVAALVESGAANVGGVWLIVPGVPTKFGWTIAKVLANRFGVGNAQYRLARLKGRKWVDTVPFLCCWKTLFDKVGYFNEKLTRTQDIEFNRRIRKIGGGILLCPEIEITYFARARFAAMAHHAWKTGLWIVLPFLYSDVVPISWRHLAPLAFLTSLMIAGTAAFFSPLALFVLGLILLAYISCALLASVEIAMQEKDFTYFALAPFVFATFHISYGIGSLCGVFQLLLSLLKNRKLTLRGA
jgi:glycosyltransferase involved in cell wall biosynthesis